MLTRLKHFVIDVAWGIVWAALLVAVVIFASGASQFIYIDF